MEMSQQSLFLTVFIGCMVALVTWCAITFTIGFLWRAYEARKMARIADSATRAIREDMQSCPLAPPGSEAWKIMEAHADLSLAALDVPGAVPVADLRKAVDGNAEQLVWLKRLVSTAQQYKRVLPERNQQMMRAERRAKAESAKYVGDE